MPGIIAPRYAAKFWRGAYGEGTGKTGEIFYLMPTMVG